ncbi:MAG: hypothetical protein HBSAPP03_00580 [Phycisphaerae bacterium]|nr:MAG: hypothetical protein HBSAPP03_00580 [Phycisphaerae bacterium]
MKSVWTILAVVAVANMVALGAFAGWLVASDRMDTRRATVIRAMVSKTITQERSEALEAETAAKAQRDAAELALKNNRAPLTAFEKLAARGEATEIDRQRAERLQREVADLQAQLARDLDDVARQRAALEQDRATFNALVNATRLKLNDQQFRKTLDVLTSLKPAQAAALLTEMLRPSGAPGGAASATDPGLPVAGWSESHMNTVVGYLDAMGDDRTKIIAEWLKTDPALAAELLERLRNRAAFARVPRNSP